ncbi:hypothetical protein ILUMI_15108, partial [Ignelater luminosus]
MKFTRGTLGEYITVFEKMVTDLRASGGKIDDEEIISQLLASMPESYQAVTTSIHIIFSTNPKDINFQFVKNTLLQEETRRNNDRQNNEGVAFVGKQKYIKKGNGSFEGRSNTKVSGNKAFPYRCYKCGKQGHKRSDCPEVNAKKGAFAVKEEHEIAFITEANSQKPNSENHDEYVDMSKLLDADCFGDIKEANFIFNKIESEGLKVSFENKTVRILKGTNIVAEGYLHGNLYLITFTLKYAGANVTVCDADLLHRRMGHSSVYPPKKLCDRLLEVVSSDVAGPIMPTSHDGMRYYVTFVEHFSHFTMVYLMKNKNEVFNKFKEYVTLVTAQFSVKISKLRCDNGGEYSSKEFKDFCCKNGIQIQYTIPRNPEPNGVCERFNRAVMNMARCLLIQSEMSKTFWREAVRSATYIINRLPTSALKDGKMPAELCVIFDEEQKSLDLQNENNVPLPTFEDKEEGETVKTPEKIQGRDELN